MTATIHGLTLLVPGPHTHQRRYIGGRGYWHCSTTDGPCQGHGPVSPAPNSAPNSGKWCPKGLHQDEMRERTDQNSRYCRGCERERERSRRRAA